MVYEYFGSATTDCFECWSFFDIIGALLVANEVVRVFYGSVTIDIGNAGCINGGTRLVPSPEFEAHERRKRRIMKWGLGLLLVGFVLQGVAAWFPLLVKSEC